VPLLAGHGHSVHTPTLTGLGERSHLAHPGIVLQTHVDDVVNMLTYEDLRGMILVGTSSSGAVITASPTGRQTGSLSSSAWMPSSPATGRPCGT
jgi:hypothetical protein